MNVKPTFCARTMMRETAVAAGTSSSSRARRTTELSVPGLALLTNLACVVPSALGGVFYADTLQSP